MILRMVVGVCVGGILLAGCQEPRDAAHARPGSPEAARLATERLNAGPLDGGPESVLPMRVRDAFARDYPSGSITGVTPIVAVDRTALYRIMFYGPGGQPQTALYEAGGRLMPEGTTIFPDHQRYGEPGSMPSGRGWTPRSPMKATAPGTQPSGRGAGGENLETY